MGRGVCVEAERWDECWWVFASVRVRGCAGELWSEGDWVLGHMGSSGQLCSGLAVARASRKVARRRGCLVALASASSLVRGTCISICP